MPKRFTPAEETEMCRRYLGGESSIQLGKLFKTSNGTICHVLKRNGVKARSTSEAMGGLSPETEALVCARYLTGESAAKLAKIFRVTTNTIARILRRSGVKVRSNSEAKGGLGVEIEEIVCARYQRGENTCQLGKIFEVAQGTILSILKRHNVEIRSAGIAFGDSVQHILDSTGRHAEPRECSFYLFELAGYSETHCKPGISFDVSSRVNKGGGQYGLKVLEQVFATRAEAWFLEQAVLDQTRSSNAAAAPPEELKDWIGATEIRSMSADAMEPTVSRLAEELEELGIWNFAAAYVPMTAAQRALCQQKSLLSLHTRNK